MYSEFIMKIERYRENGKILNRAFDKAQEYMFKHCAGGMVAVPTRTYTNDVEPLLQCHGIMIIEIVDNT